MGASLFGKRIEVEAFLRSKGPLRTSPPASMRRIGQARVDYDVKVSGGVAYVVQGNDGWEVNRQTLAGLLGGAMLGSSDGRNRRAYRVHPRAAYRPKPLLEAGPGRHLGALPAARVSKFGGHTWQATACRGRRLGIHVRGAGGDGWRLRPYIDQQLSKSAMASGIRQAEGRFALGRRLRDR